MQGGEGTCCLFKKKKTAHLIWRNQNFAYFGEELVAEDLIQRESVAGVFLQDA